MKLGRFGISALLAILLLVPGAALAQVPSLTIGLGEASGPQQVSTTIQVLFILTVLSLAPAILLMTTGFTRIVIVLSFVRQAMGTQQMPPNQVIIGLALFLTFFVMAPVWTQVNDQALQPYLQQQISQEQALELALPPIRGFMLKQTQEKDLELLMNIAGIEAPESSEDVPTMTLIPSFMLSELKRAFQMGFLIYIPFLVIDMVVASVLMAMGMMMLPPPIISLPFKLLLFVLVDGWQLVVGSLVQSFF
ncbi:flagellar biosynthetic protein FliP [Desulfuromonas versatilis]|uniref:Flagellar biosynthetic protein FliP n=1 Tax=Desulfuromonas versatilis TaxID=2802975 RepID=A0ABN6E338_9BACT|nr:flagellar type III secretion system pore protein FliP [Desulfuromonas versatilis]BCR06622.1 flagellar biosynthetic protein FliP [Desulfuromonas versatilis]